MRRKVVASVLIGTVLAATLFTGCGGSGKVNQVQMKEE